MYLRDGAERHWHQHERHCIHPVGLWRVRELQQQRRSPDEWQPVTATGGSAIDIVGNVLKSGSPTISPAPTIGAPVTPDPLARHESAVRMVVVSQLHRYRPLDGFWDGC
jgi:hypothetical protein